MDIQHNSPSCCVLFAGAGRNIARLAIVMCVANILFPISLVSYAELTGENYWEMFLGERNAMTWFSSVQLIVVGGIAYMNYQAALFLRRVDKKQVTQYPWIWLIFACGFVFLALDERFQIHEALRDDVFKPGGFFVGVPYIGAGDVGLLLFFGIGIFFASFLFSELRRKPQSLALFIAALVLTLSTAMLDSYEMSLPRQQRTIMRYFWTSIVEEEGELWAQLLFLLSFIVLLTTRLKYLSTIAPEYKQCLDSFVQTVKRQAIVFAVVFGIINLLLPIGQYVYAESIGRATWKMFRGEFSAVAWFSSVQLLIVGFVAYLNYKGARLLKYFRITAISPNSWIWLVFSLGFILLSIDERFEIHEMLRDEVFLPGGLIVDSPYLIEGDLGLYLFFLIGMIFTPFLVVELRRRPAAAALFFAAIVLTIPILIIDSLKDSAMYDWRYRYFWDYTFEEVGEIWAQFLFLSSFLIMYHWNIGKLEVSTHPVAS